MTGDRGGPGESGSQVLVVGAGPVGLTLACELRRRDVPCRLVERAAERERESKGIWVMPRSLEIFDRLGITDRLLPRGRRLIANDFYTRGRRIASVGFRRVRDSRFPFALVIPQWEVEDALRDLLADLGGSIENEVTLTGIDQDDAGVSATLVHAGGRVERSRFGWLAGCDGHGSTVRSLLDIPFEGEQYATTLLLADAVLEGQLAGDRSHTFQGTTGAFIAVPLPGGLFRAVVYGPPSHGRVEPTLDKIQALIDEHGPGGLRLHDPRWLSAFRIQRRIAARLRQGRCLLAGDSAHEHSPFGGQGMNTGIQDAHNLAWKLALAVGSTPDDPIIESYHQERHQVARRVLRDTDRQTRAFLHKSPLMTAVRDTIFRLLDRAGVLERRLGPAFAGYYDTYRTSPLTRQLAHGTGRGAGRRRPRPGERLPDLPISAASDQSGGSLLGWMDPRRFTMLLVSDPAEPAGLEPLAAAVSPADPLVAVRVVWPGADRSTLPGTLARHPWLADEDAVLRQRLGAPQGGVLLVRPDGFVASRGDTGGARQVLDELRRMRPLASVGGSTPSAPDHSVATGSAT
jgi:3-(3-hydroxy-phenyl)propionate hydroxylase